LLDQLKSLAQQNGATLYVVLLAAYFAFLHRYTGQADLIVGTPVTNRSLPETEKIIGFFLNTLALRTRVDGSSRFIDFLSQVKNETRLALENQEAPFEKVVDEVQPKRDLSHHPIFQTMFVWNQDAVSALRLSNVDVEMIWIDGGASKFDLTFFAGELKNKLEIAAEFAVDLFDIETIDRMLDNFGVFLRSIAFDPTTTIATLPILTEAEYHRVWVEWNQTQTNFPRESLIHELIESRAKEKPNAPAIFFDDQELSYGELDMRANQLAIALREHGLTNNTPIALCVERSSEMIIGIVGILKAGGAYVPIDPSYPQERIAFVLEDTQTPIILTQKHLAPRMPKTHAKIIALDDAPKSIDTLPTSIAQRSDSIAYII
jgi:non-ribosomal peptide synthetase component F